MSEPRRHHVVSAVLLKGFTAAEERSGVLYVFDPATGLTEQKTPETHGWIWDYNRIEGPRATAVESEFFSGLIESPVGGPFKKIRAGSSLTKEDGMDLCAYIAAQAVRVPARRETIQRFMKDLCDVTELVRDSRGMPIDDPLVTRLSTGGSLTNYDYLAMQLPLIDELGEWLWKRHCIILTATGNEEFVCTDDPVVLGGPMDRSVGFRNASYIFMPCGRKHALLFPYDVPGMAVGWYPMDADDMAVTTYNWELIRRGPKWIVSAQPDFSFNPGDGQIHRKADVSLITYPSAEARDA